MKVTKLVLASFVLFFNLSCKKSSNDIDPQPSEKVSTLTMDINGTSWSGNCGAMDAKIGNSTNVAITSDNKPKTDVIVISLIGYTGTGDYAPSLKLESSISIIYNGLNYKYDKKSTDPLVVKITESNMPTKPLGPGKLSGEFSGTFKNVEGGKSIVITKGKFSTTTII